MAVVGYFPATLAVDSNTGTRLRNAEAQVYAMTDTSFSSPLAITDVAGVPITGNKLVSNSDGIYPEFKPPAGVTQVIVKSGQALTPMTDISVSAAAAEVAATNAATAAGTATTAAGAASTSASSAATAAAQAAAVGNTNDTIIEGRIKDSTSKTAVALKSTIDASLDESVPGIASQRIASDLAVPGGAVGGVASPSLPYNGPASILDPKFRPANVTAVSVANGTYDCSGIIEAIWAAGFSTILLPTGAFGLAATTYRITRTIDLGTTRSLIGGGRGQRSAGTGAACILWDGASGARAIASFTIDTTDRYKTYSGSLVNFRLKYPSAKIAAGSVGIYLGRPSFGEIRNVEVRGDTDDNSIAPVVGSYAWWLDGCENPGAILLLNCTAAHHFEDGFRIAASHVALIAPATAYVGNGYRIAQDSINSPAGPPYNVTVLAPHSYYSVSSHVRVSQAQSGTVIGGFSEPEPVVSDTLPAILADTSFSSGFVSLRGMKRTRGTVITHYGAGRVIVDSEQDGTRAVYTGTAGTGAPVVSDQISTARRQTIGYGDYSTSSTVNKRAVTGSSPALIPGARGGFRYRFTAMVKNSDAAGGYKVAVSQVSSSSAPSGIAQDAVVSNSDLFGAQSKTVVTAAGVAERVIVEGFVDGQSGSYVFVPTAIAIGAGTVTVTDRLLQIEAY